MSSPTTDSCNVYIAGLPTTFDDSQLLDLVCMRCCEQQAVDSIKCVMDPRTKQCRGYGFVLFNQPSLAAHCVRVLDGATIQVTNERNEISSSHHLQVRTAHVSAQPTRHDICSRNAANIPTLPNSGSGNASPVQGAPPPPPYHQTVGVTATVPLSGPQQIAFQPSHPMVGNTLSLSSSGVFATQQQHHVLPSLFVGTNSSGSGQLLSSNGASSFRSLNATDDSSYGGHGSPHWSRTAIAPSAPNQNAMQITTSSLADSTLQLSFQPQRPQMFASSQSNSTTTTGTIFVPAPAATHIQFTQPSASQRDDAKQRPDSPAQAFLADSLFTSTMETPLFSVQVGAGPAPATNVNNMSSSQLHSVTRLSAPTSGTSTSGTQVSQPTYSVMRTDAPPPAGTSLSTLPQHVQGQPGQLGLSFSALPATISLVHAAPPSISPGASLSNVFDQHTMRSPPESAFRSQAGGMPVLTSPMPQQPGSSAIFMQAQQFAPPQQPHTPLQHQQQQMLQFYPSSSYPTAHHEQQQQPVFVTPQQLAALQRHHSGAPPSNFAPQSSIGISSAYPQHAPSQQNQQFMSHITSPTYTTTPLGPSHQSPHLSSPHTSGYFTLVNSPMVQQHQQQLSAMHQQQQQFQQMVASSSGNPQQTRPTFVSGGPVQVPTTPIFGQGPSVHVGSAYSSGSGGQSSSNAF
jgi:hypothetical protein